ncbi:YggT family protein [Dyella sp. 2RAB6]|uniref:YggT family protein n=1 Tax=Dyella sp. 2RAB6 TaxID=3232992 RepID=UPI003F8DDAEA
MSYLLNALTFLINLVFGAVTTLFLLRLLAEATRADFNNPLSQFLYRYTNPVLAPLRRVLPNWRRINLSCVLLLWVLMLLQRLVMFALYGQAPNPLGLLVLGLADLLDFVLLTYLVLIFIWSLLSLFPMDQRHPALRLIGSLVAPVLRPLRGKLVAGGLDFSPWVAVIVLVLVRILVAAPLTALGVQLALGR